MFGIIKIILMVLATLLCFVITVTWFKGEKNYRAYADAIGGFMSDFYISGFQILESVKFNYKGRYARKMIRNCRILYGEQYAEFYFQVNMAKKITMGLFILMFGFVLSALMGEYVVLLLVIGAAGGTVYYFETTIMDDINKRQEGIMRDFPNVLSKLALLVNAGMIMREAWEKTAYSAEGVIYDEMRNTVEQMKNGVSEFDALLEFSMQCNVDSVTKFISTLVQNLTKGNRELVEFLKRFANESWYEKKQNARRKGEEASSKLLIPIVIMFIGILIIVVIPIFMGLSI